MPRRTLFCHIGASKTGTSALQAGLFASGPVLLEQGIAMPLASRDAHIRQVLRPLGWVTASGFVRRVRKERLEQLGARLAHTTAPTVLMTCEDLCELDAGRIEQLAGVVERADLDLRVVLTVRNLAAVIPSEWQQFLKHRMTTDYPTFLEQVREHEGRWADHFWQRQDVAAICDRWSTVVGANRLDVVVTPDRSTDQDGLYRMFGDVVGFAPGALTWPERNVNPSWGYVEAEVYRRTNAALGDRLPRYERDYQPGVRWPLVQGVLPRSASARIPLPTEHLGWVTEVAARHRDHLASGSIRVHGDLDSLVPSAADARPLPELTDAAVADAAVEALANLAVFALRRQRGRATPAPASLPRRVVRAARRRLARLRSG